MSAGAPSPAPSSAFAFVRLALALAGQIGVVLLSHEWSGGDPQFTLFGVVLYPIYLSVSWVWRPDPDMKNLGAMGVPFLDRPFDLSDDLNRTLLFARIFLLPGRFLAGGVVAVWDLLSESE